MRGWLAMRTMRLGQVSCQIPSCSRRLCVATAAIGSTTAPAPAAAAGIAHAADACHCFLLSLGRERPCCCITDAPAVAAAALALEQLQRLVCGVMPD